MQLARLGGDDANLQPAWGPANYTLVVPSKFKPLVEFALCGVTNLLATSESTPRPGPLVTNGEARGN